MTTRWHRLTTGLATFVLAFLSGFVWNEYGQPPLFNVRHIASLLLAVCVPIVFVLLGRRASGRPGLLKIGAVLLSLAGIPLHVANLMYLIGGVESTGNDIGGIGLALLGWGALLLTSLTLTTVLVFGGSAAAQRLDNRSSSSAA